jgi:hypothetical protein
MPEDVVAQIDRQVAFLHRCRAVFPRLGSELVGQSKFEAAEYFKQQGHNVEVQLSMPLTEALLNELNELAHWLNENFIVRLYAVMDGNHLAGGTPINQQLDGWEELDILRRLRSQIAHGSKGYDPTDTEKLQLYQRIVTPFGIAADYSYLDGAKYPIGIAKVLVPIAQGCKRYAAAHQAAAALQQPPNANQEDNAV